MQANRGYVSRYPEIDLTRVRAFSVESRESKVAAGQLYRPPDDPASFEALWQSLPDVLGARDLRELVDRTVAARERGAGRLVMLGAHVLKTGMGPGLVRAMERGWITALAMNGACAVHDLELAFLGRTSEDVAHALPQGKFGMARETAERLNRWTAEAAEREEGLGEGLGRAFLEHDAPHVEHSVLATAYRLGIPATLHLSLGTDINQQHPSFPGAAAGETSMRDFRILCQAVRSLAKGVALNVGSAVILPEVFLKAVSVCINLGTVFSDLTTAVFDFQRQYRPLENVVRRPTLQGGRGFYLVGQHEILLPIFFQALASREAALAPGVSASGASASGASASGASASPASSKSAGSAGSAPPEAGGR